MVLEKEKLAEVLPGPRINPFYILPASYEILKFSGKYI